MMNLKQAVDSLPEIDKKQNVVAVLSGGLDSTIMTYILKAKYGQRPEEKYSRVVALSFDYGQKQKRELEMAKKTCEYLCIKHHVLDLGILGKIAKPMSANIGGSDVKMPTIKEVLGDPQPKTYVPFRNMILNALAFSFAEAHNAAYVFTGLQVHDEYGYWDTTQKFVDSMNAVADQNRSHKVKLIAPFSHLSKFQELEIAKQIGNVRLDYTLTCYNPNDKGESCGKCPSCSERIANFAKARMVDPIEYSIDIPWEKLLA